MATKLRLFLKSEAFLKFRQNSHNGPSRLVARLQLLDYSSNSANHDRHCSPTTVDAY